MAGRPEPKSPLPDDGRRRHRCAWRRGGVELVRRHRRRIPLNRRPTEDDSFPRRPPVTHAGLAIFRNCPFPPKMLTASRVGHAAAVCDPLRAFAVCVNVRANYRVYFCSGRDRCKREGKRRSKQESAHCASCSGLQSVGHVVSPSVRGPEWAVVEGNSADLGVPPVIAQQPESTARWGRVSCPLSKQAGQPVLGSSCAG